MRILHLRFHLPLHPGDLSAFRAAIAELVGLEHELFHNHDNREGQPYLHWSYPLLQYQVRQGYAALTALGQGRDAVYQHLLPQLPVTLHFAGQSRMLQGYQADEQVYTWSLHAKPISYGLVHWLALNADNYAAWQSTTDEAKRLDLLNQALTGHLRNLAKTLGFPNTDLVHGQVLHVDRIKKMNWHGQAFMGFDALISSNIALPEGLGLGRCVAFGFGEILGEADYTRLRKRQKSAQPKNVL